MLSKTLVLDKVSLTQLPRYFESRLADATGTERKPKNKRKKRLKKKKSRHWEIKHTQIWQAFHCDYTWFKFLTASSFCMKAQGVPPHPISLSWANSFLTSLSFLTDHKAEGTIGLNIQFGQNIRTFPQRVSWGLTKRGRRLGCFDVESVAGLCFDWSL